MFVLYREDKGDSKFFEAEVMYIVEDRKTADEWIARLRKLEEMVDVAFGTSSNWYWQEIDGISKEFKEPWYVESARKKLKNV